MWSKVADYSQRAVSISLWGLTVYGLYMIGKGGVRAWNRKKAKEITEENSQD